MVFRQWLRAFWGPTWPRDIPRLYPGLDGVALCEFMSAETAHEISRFPLVQILPFASSDDDEVSQLFGVGLARLMIRDLMLVRNISVHGPEDTPTIYLEAAREGIAETGHLGMSYISGRALVDGNALTVELELLQNGKATQSKIVRSADLHEQLFNCAFAIAHLVGGDVDQDVVSKWKVARPSTIQSLVDLGAMKVACDSEAERASAAFRLFADDKSFGLPGGELDSEQPTARKAYLETMRRDPYDAQVCFSMLCNVFSGLNRAEPHAMQYSRRAIELSPGHGKAHMCAPHAADPKAQMLHHSELGYRLLPGNPFAISNYINNLIRAGAPAERLLELAQEGIAADPHDPANYEQMIAVFCNLKQYSTALKVAESLQPLFEPEMNARALYCLRQNPERARMIDTGEYNPAQVNRDRISQLRRLAN